MNNFVEAFRFIFRNGQIPGQPHFTTLTYYALGTLKVTVIAMAISLVIALPIGVWLGHLHRGSFVAINLGNIVARAAEPGRAGDRLRRSSGSA